jgi:hypothetical protein
MRHQDVLKRLAALSAIDLRFRWNRTGRANLTEAFILKTWPIFWAKAPRR